MSTADIYDGAYPEPTGSTTINAKYFKITFNDSVWGGACYFDDYDILYSGTSIRGSSSITSSTGTTSATYFAPGDWIKIAFGSSTNVDCIAIKTDHIAGAIDTLRPGQMPKDIKIETSNDDVTYTERFDGKVGSLSYNGFTSSLSYGLLLHPNGATFNWDTSIAYSTVDATGNPGYRYYALFALNVFKEYGVPVDEIYLSGASMTIGTNSGVYPVSQSSYVRDSVTYDSETIDNDATSKWQFISQVSISSASTGGPWSLYSSGNKIEYDFGRRVEPTSIRLDFPSTSERIDAFKLYGFNDPAGTYDLLLYVNDFDWSNRYTATFGIDTGASGASYTASGYVIRNGSGDSATVRFYNHTTGALIYETSSSAVDGSWTYYSNSNAAIDVVVIGDESEEIQISNKITPVAV